MRDCPEEMLRLLTTAAMLLATGQLAMLLAEYPLKRPTRILWIQAASFGTAFLLVVFLLDCLFALENTPGFFREASPPQAFFLSVPWTVWAALEALQGFLITLQARAIIRYRKNHLTLNAIKETIDLMPTALCVCDGAGTVLLANMEMDALCRELTGEMLTDGNRFWQQIRETGEKREGNILVHAGEKIWMFGRNALEGSGTGQEWQQIAAADMTEPHRIMEELEKKNRRLKEVQFRMKSVAALERSFIASREIMNARVTVHNQLGGVLLSGKYYLDHPEEMDEAEVLRLLEYGNYFLMREAEQQENEPDPLQEALRTAKRIGVRVEIRGEVPEQPEARRLLAEAVTQGSSNTVRHAEGDLLQVLTGKEKGRLILEMTNNGRPPEKPVSETGGLADLRRAVEAAGGKMLVESSPAFRLKIIL